jgi:hypothetical protein
MSWYLTACKASFNNQCSFPKASKNLYTWPSIALVYTYLQLLGQHDTDAH